MQDKKNSEFKPYIPAEETPPEFSITAVIVGVILAIVFGAANTYLGLRVGMSISASIPAAVISMMVLRVILRRNSILENNLVQTIASAGESIAAGIVFTVPAFFLWEKEGVIEPQPFSTITLLALFGGILGILFMIPLRHYLIVQENETLRYPEGRACAEVLLAAEKGADQSKYVFWGAAFAAVTKILIDACHFTSSILMFPLRKYHTAISAEPYPALLGVGYICGLEVSATLFAGSLLSWLVLIPLIVTFGGENVVFPAHVSIWTLYTESGPHAIWANYIRYIGAGAVAAGGIIGLIKSLPVIFASFVNGIRGIGKGGGEVKRTEHDIGAKALLAMIVICFILLVALPQIPLNFWGVLLFMICGFFFSVVASRIVGVIGASNSPCSGMTIAALIVSSCILKKAGVTGSTGMIASLSIATMCCVITAIAGDTSQDLKTGFLLGATPWKQQVGEIIACFATAACIGGIILLLNNAWGFGSAQLPAPQAHLMKLVTEGVMAGTLSWPLILVGAAIAVVVEFFGVSSLCVAIGVFLPMGSTAAVFLGGVARYFVDRRKAAPQNGILFSSGLIAGEGLMGILLAVLAVLHLDKQLDLSRFVNLGNIGCAIVILLTMFLLSACCRKENAAVAKPAKGK